MSRSPLFLACTWLMACLSVVTAGLAIRLAPIEQAFAWPTFEILSFASLFTGITALIIAVTTVILMVIFASAAREGARPRPYAELILFFPLLFAFIWMILPVGALQTREWIISAALALGAGWLARHCPGPIAGPLWRSKPESLVIDALLILLPMALGLVLGNTPDLKASGFSLLLYPVYAFIQLMVFLYIPVTRLRALGVSKANSSLLAALVFSLVHWPNPLVMLVTAAGMLIWAHQFQKGRPLWQLALVMGLTATTFSQFLPDDLTRHMRVGPGYVRAESVMFLARRAVTKEQCDSAEYIRTLYPDTIGREATAGELKLWVDILTTARRSTWANIFMVSTEYRQKLSTEGNPLPPGPEFHWTTWPPEWKNMVLKYADDEYWQNCGSTDYNFLRSLYENILGRQASPDELNSWGPSLSIGQRKRIAEVLLEIRMISGQQEFTGISIEDLKLSN